MQIHCDTIKRPNLAHHRALLSPGQTGSLSSSNEIVDCLEEVGELDSSYWKAGMMQNT
jgi:hypothetical protein